MKRLLFLILSLVFISMSYAAEPIVYMDTAEITSGTITGITDLAVADGGTGASTLADGGIVVGNGTTAVEVVSPGATTTILVGGGAATNPVWTTATGSGAPVRATSPTIVTPAIDIINESTVGAGVTIDSVLLKDGGVTASPLKAKGPAIIETFAGTVTATASTTVTFSSAADAILAGYSATNPILGTTLISNALTRYIVSWTNATTCVVDSSVTWAGTAITSVQLPIITFVNSAGVTQGWMNAAGRMYFYSAGTDGQVVYDFNAPTAVKSVLRWGYNGVFNFELGRIANAPAFALLDSTLGYIMYFPLSTGNILTGGLTAAGTSAAKVLAIGSGTAPTTSPADAAQMWVQDYLGVAGDARLHIMGEGSAAAKAVLGSGKVGITGTTGGFTRQLSEAVSAALSGATGSIAVNVPSGARILGVQLRVDTAITSDNATKTWAADYVNTPTTAITSGQVFDANTKFNAIHPAYEITTGTVTITITAAAGSFTGGVVRAIVYYESLDNMSSL
jgi:hypothetical protein